MWVYMEAVIQPITRILINSILTSTPGDRLLLGLFWFFSTQHVGS